MQNNNLTAELVAMTIIRTLGQALAFWVVLPLWGIGYEVSREVEKTIS